MSPALGRETSGDDSEEKRSPEILSPKETKIAETLDEAWKNVIREISSNKSNISANNYSEDNANVKTMLQSSSNGGDVDNGESEVVPNNSNVGGKTTSALKPSPSVGISLENLLEAPTGSSGKNGSSESGSTTSMMDEAWEQLTRSYVKFKGKRVGALAAIDTGGETLNYNQVVR